MPNIDQVQLPDGSQYNLKDNISDYVTAGYVDDAIDALTKADVGLGNVDNTSDLNKPVSTAQQTALNGKTNTTVIAPTEATTTASRRYEIGEQFILNGVLYTATAVIASGDTIIVDTNCELSESITKQLKDIDLSADNVTFDNTGTGLVSENVEGAIKEVNEKTGTQMDLLWNNDIPTANTDYTLNSSIEGYKVILIIMRTNYEHTSVYIPVEEIEAYYGRSHSYGTFLSVGNEGVQAAPFAYNSGCLNFFVNATTFLFKYSSNNANWVLKPTRIYGIK